MSRLLIYILLFVAIDLSAQLSTDAVIDADKYTTRPKVGLSLSGGAAHGLAHIGVLKYMDELGIQVDYIAATSMGAVIGALYAIGYDAQQCQEIAGSMDWPSVFNNKIQHKDVAPIEKYSHRKYPLNIDYRNGKLVIPEGIIVSNKLDLVLEELYASAYLTNDFNDFNIPFKCCAVDIVDGTVVELSSGRLSQSVRASMAIPSIFSPVTIDDRLLVDGGLIRNFPSTNVKEMGADIVIGSYVGSDRGDASQLGSLFDILKQSAFMMSIADSEEQARKTDILILPNIKGEPVMGFEKYKTFIDSGYQAAKQQKDKFLQLKYILDSYETPKVRPKLEKPGFIFINDIIIKDATPGMTRIIREKLRIKERSYITFKNLNKGVEAIYATKNFSKVEYHLSPSGEGTNLVIEASESKLTRFGANINHFTSTKSALILNIEARNMLGRLSNLHLTMRVSENIGLAGDYYKRVNLLKDGLLLGVNTKMEKLDLPFIRKGEELRSMNLWEGYIRPFVMWEPNNLVNLKAYWQAEFKHAANNLVIGSDVNTYALRQYSFGINFNYNTLDRAYFGTKGVDFQAGAQYAYSNNAEIDFATEIETKGVTAPTTYLMPQVKVNSYIPLHAKWNLQFLAAAAYRKEGYFLDNMLIGGSYQDKEDRLSFIGMDESELHLATYVYGKLALRRQVSQMIYISAVINAVGGNNPTTAYITAGAPTDFISKVGVGLSLGVDLPTGPLNFDVGYRPNEDILGAYLGLGYRHIY